MATRREQLAALNAEPGGTGGNSEGSTDPTESGIPFPIFLEEQVSSDAYQTRIKVPADKSSEKTDKSEKPSFSERKAQRTGGTASERQLAEIGESLTDKIDTIAVIARDYLPVTSVYAADRGPDAVKALLNIAKRRPKLLAILSKSADGIDAVEVAKFAVGLVVALQVDMGRLTGEEIPARVVGVSAVIEEYFSDRQEPVTNPSVLVQAPHYVPVV